ncbi:MAG: hypothetical protein JWO53_1361 [Chlamydiia bacterium]|nr:hypothetical protein [Chlamydiia bacterium]
MKKWITFFVLFTLLIVVSFVGYTYLHRAEFLSTILSKTLNISMKVKNIQISKHGLLVKGINVQNPQGCTLKNALQVDRIEVKMDWVELVKALIGVKNKKIVIDQIKIISPQMSVELFTLTGSDTNWKRLLSNMPAGNDEPSSRKFEIKRLVITNIGLEIKQQNISQSSFKPSPIAKLEFKNLGSDTAASAQEIIRGVFTALVSEAAKELQLKNMQPEEVIKKLPPTVQDGVKQAGDQIKGWLRKK